MDISMMSVTCPVKKKSLHVKGTNCQSCHCWKSNTLVDKGRNSKFSYLFGPWRLNIGYMFKVYFPRLVLFVMPAKNGSTLYVIAWEKILDNLRKVSFSCRRKHIKFSSRGMLNANNERSITLNWSKWPSLRTQVMLQL